jgi:hypothetical protein
MPLANENSPIASVWRLRSAGLDAVAVIEETPGATDAQIVQCAEREQRVTLENPADTGPPDDGAPL